MKLEDKNIFRISRSSKDTKNVLSTNKRYTYILEIQKNLDIQKMDMLEVFKDTKLR